MNVELEKNFEAAIYVTVSLTINAVGPAKGEVKEQRLYVGNIPIMTKAVDIHYQWS